MPEGVNESAPLLAFLHGFGADERDLLPIASMLPGQFAVMSVRAPLALGFGGYAWFPLSSQDLEFNSADYSQVVEDLTHWVAERKKHHESVTLLGFSQGMAMATAVARRDPSAVDALVGLSGFTLEQFKDETGADFFKDQELAAREEKLPMFWGRDPEDPVIPERFIEPTNAWARANTDLTKVNYQGIGHGVGQAEIRHIGEFLTAKVLGAQV
ncbi:hypothetical protein HMPREF3160_07255 [Arthrobacter sp. HMSC06H05]|nr:hypothetical protein HMPREF3175_03450 [Arthrobacter sp. HMSC08H08]OFT41650.1 hypothetical protein HMPREF3160_07255 [Arthrobacter sp. HMSC06H05]